MAGAVWLYPTQQAAEAQRTFWEMWWAQSSTLEVNRLDSSALFQLPLSQSTRRAWWYRIEHQWHIEHPEALQQLPKMDTVWFWAGHRAKKFSFALPEPVQEEKITRPSSPPWASASSKTTAAVTTPPARVRPIELHSADSSDWISIPGIGPWTAHRILQEREKWGTLAGQAHLKTIYGLKERWNVAWDTLLLESPVVKRWNINESTMQELLSCPGFNYAQVKRMVFYRENFGALTWREVAQWPEFGQIDTTFLKLLVSQ